MDALCKAMEALWASNATGISRQYAWRTISMILPHIEKACKEGDILSRRAMSLAAYLAGKAIHISNMTGPHALSGYLTDHMGLHPGEALAINMELFIEMNLPSLPESLQSDFLSLFNVRNTEELAWYISNLKHRLGLKMSIAEAGIDNRDALETYLDSVQPEYMENNPVKPCKEELFRVYCNIIPNIDSQGNNGILLQNR